MNILCSLNIIYISNEMDLFFGNNVIFIHDSEHYYDIIILYY